MTVGGWIFMLGSLAVVYSVAIWCYIRVLTHHERSEDREG